MAETIPVKIIARIRTDFATKFGVPRQSGLVESLRGEIVFEPDFRNPESGSLRCARPGWGAISPWASLPPAPPTAPTPSDCPR